MEAELEAAVRGGGLALHYQTIFDLDKADLPRSRLCCAGITLREGLLDASAFIDIAEVSGLLAQIGPWVVAEAASSWLAGTRSWGPAPRSRSLSISR